jgi:hypothetical protein
MQEQRKRHEREKQETHGPHRSPERNLGPCLSNIKYAFHIYLPHPTRESHDFNQLAFYFTCLYFSI